jgi:hypothetical protein
MKNKQFVFSLLLLVVGLMDVNARSFGEAVKRNEVKYEVVAIPGPRRMLLKIKNLLSRQTRVNLEAGRFFYNSPTVQPFVVSRPVAIELDPGEEREVALQAFCGNSSARCPMVDQKFNKTEMGPANLSAVLQMMDKNRIVGNSLYQQVIWFYTNKHQLASVCSYDVDMKNIQKVQQFICNKEAIKMPTYKIKYSPPLTGDELEFSGRPDEIEGNLKFKLENRSDLHVQVLDAQGKQVELLEVHLDQPSGLVELPVVLRVVGYNLGDYTVAVSDERGNILGSMPVRVS